MPPRNERVAPDVPVRSPARSLARSLDSYYRPARDSRSEQALQRGISRLSGLFEERAARAKQTQRKDEFQQGVTDAMREQAGEEIQGVKTGSIFRQHSKFYTAGLNETRGKAAATEFKNNLALEYENWEGRHTDDDGSGFHEWMSDQVAGFIDSLGDDQSRRTGALPVLAEVTNNFAAQHTAFTNQRLQEEAFKATQTIAGGIFDDFAMGTLTEDQAIAEIREEAGALYDVEGGNANSVLVDAAIRYADIHNDPDPILLLGKAHTSGELPLSLENQGRLMDAMDAVEADIARNAQEQEQIRDAEQKAEHQAALGEFGQQLAQDPYAPLPRHGEVGHDLWTDMNRLRQSHITAAQNTNPVEGSIARLNLDVALREAGSAREAVSVLHEFVQSHPNVLTGAQVSAYSQRIQDQLDPTSLMNNDYVKQQGRLFFQQVNQFETDAFSPDQITILQTKSEQHFLDYVMSQSGEIDTSNPGALHGLVQEAREYAVSRLTEEHPELVRERVLDSELSDDLGFEQEVSRRDRERFEATLQRTQSAPEGEATGQPVEPIIRGEEDTPFEDPDQEAVTYTPEREGFYGQLINRFTDGRDDRVSMASAMEVYQEDPEFASELDRLGDKYGVNPAALMAVMDFETGGTFDPAIRNAAGSGATGLIQFMPATARSLGTTTEALASMSRADQMKYVEAYFDQFGDRIRGGEVDDLYMAVLWPRAIGKPDGYVIFRQGTIAYDQNKGLDINGDGTVTKYEAASRVARKFYGY